MIDWLFVFQLELIQIQLRILVGAGVELYKSYWPHDWLVICISAGIYSEPVAYPKWGRGGIFCNFIEYSKLKSKCLLSIDI